MDFIKGTAFLNGASISFTRSRGRSLCEVSKQRGSSAINCTMLSEVSRRKLLYVLSGALLSLSYNTEARGDTEQITETQGGLFSWIHSFYKKQFAKVMENDMVEYEKWISNRKANLFNHIPEKQNGIDLLEIGIGTGSNLVYYPSNTRVTGIEPNRTKPFKFFKEQLYPES